MNDTFPNECRISAYVFPMMNYDNYEEELYKVRDELRKRDQGIDFPTFIEYTTKTNSLYNTVMKRFNCISDLVDCVRDTADIQHDIVNNNNKYVDNNLNKWYIMPSSNGKFFSIISVYESKCSDDGLFNQKCYTYKKENLINKKTPPIVGSVFPRGSRRILQFGRRRRTGMAVNHTPISLYGEDQSLQA
ncbi:hypothetical protein U3516DRAFT_757587 [Neocallimastix sp. 'constans']